MAEDKKEKGFVVKDRRTFTEEGEVRAKEDAERKTEKTAGAQAEVKEATEETKGPEGAAEDTSLPEIGFSQFIFSLSTSALYHFGDFLDPVTKKTERNLAAAKQTIDLIAMLQKKTQGNLDDQEKSLIDAILFDLRMRFVKEKEKP